MSKDSCDGSYQFKDGPNILSVMIIFHMNIKVHRGLDQIGGCITEISTETSRVFIDFGQNLPGNGEPTTPEEDEALVKQILGLTRNLNYLILP